MDVSLADLSAAEMVFALSLLKKLRDDAKVGIVPSSIRIVPFDPFSVSEGYEDVVLIPAALRRFLHQSSHPPPPPVEAYHSAARIAEDEPPKNPFCEKSSDHETVVEEASPPPADLSRCNSCRDAILKIFQADQKRMSACQMQMRLQDFGKEYGISTVESCMTALKKLGILSSATDARGRGYGLAAWSLAEP